MPVLKTEIRSASMSTGGKAASTASARRSHLAWASIREMCDMSSVRPRRLLCTKLTHATDHSVSAGCTRCGALLTEGRCPSLWTGTTRRREERVETAKTRTVYCSIEVRMPVVSHLSSTAMLTERENVSHNKSRRQRLGADMRIVREMVRFAQDLKTCRKVAFAKVSNQPGVRA